MRLAVYAKIKNPGLVKTAANAVTLCAREEIPDSKSNYLVNQLDFYKAKVPRTVRYRLLTKGFITFLIFLTFLITEGWATVRVEAL